MRVNEEEKGRGPFCCTWFIWFINALLSVLQAVLRDSLEKIAVPFEQQEHSKGDI